IDAVVEGADQDGVERGAASAGLTMTNEHPVLLAHRARPDVAFGGVVVDRNPAVIQEGMHGTPLAEGVVERFAQPAFRADGGSAEAFERFSQNTDERLAQLLPPPRPVLLRLSLFGVSAYVLVTPHVHTV